MIRLVFYSQMITICLILLSCNEVSNKNKASNNKTAKSLNFQGKNFHGLSSSGISNYYFRWNIHFIHKDSVVIISSLKKDSNDNRKNNFQYFGRIVESEKYLAEILISKLVIVDECAKSTYYDIKDSIPFFTDSSLFSKVDFIEIRHGKHKETIDSTVFFYNKAISEDSVLFLDIEFSKESGIYPVSLQLKNYCSVSITDHNYYEERRYFIDRNQSGFYLIIDNFNNSLKRIKLNEG